ncbi:MAG: hypothetical protein EB059_08705 [Alphaproteobacteria bacterium]|nr:hypothetical protein [Alphaproteobacteria bacterium]
MNKSLEDIFNVVRSLPAIKQEEIAHVIMDLASANDEPEKLDPAHLGAILEGLEQANKGQFASHAQIEAAFKSFE